MRLHVLIKLKYVSLSLALLENLRKYIREYKRRASNHFKASIQRRYFVFIFFFMRYMHCVLIQKRRKKRITVFCALAFLAHVEQTQHKYNLIMQMYGWTRTFFFNFNFHACFKSSKKQLRVRTNTNKKSGLMICMHKLKLLLVTLDVLYMRVNNYFGLQTNIQEYTQFSAAVVCFFCQRINFKYFLFLSSFSSTRRFRSYHKLIYQC